MASNSAGRGAVRRSDLYGRSFTIESFKFDLSNPCKQVGLVITICLWQIPVEGAVLDGFDETISSLFDQCKCL